MVDNMKSTRAVAPSYHATPGARWLRAAFVAGSSALLTAAATGCSAPIEEGDPVSVPTFPGAVNPLNPGGNGGSGSGAVNGTAAQCQPGSVRCMAASRLETCNTQGTGFDVTTCDSGLACIAGACRQLSCTAGVNLCLGNELHTCNPDGKSTTLSQTCGADEGCRNSTLSCEPRLCEPLLGTCNGNVATRCDSTGFAYDFGINTDCGGQTCELGACRSPETLPDPLNPLNPPVNPGDPNPNDPPDQVSPACTANEVVCEGANTIGTCAADGSGYAITRCPNGTNCTANGTCTPVSCNPAAMLRHDGNGGVTVYWFAQGTLSVPRGVDQDVHCGFNGSRANNDDGGANDRVAYIQDPALFGAMNFGEYANAAACGACVQLNQGGRSLIVTVADSCNPAINNNGTCTPGHIDLSRSAFQQLTGQSTGDINGISWNYVPCSNVDNVQFLLKKADDQYWNEFLVVGHKYPIKRAQVLMDDGRWVDAQRTEYNYWHPAEGNSGEGGDMGTYRVRVTDINDGIIEEQLTLQGGLQGGSGQFECQ